MKCDCCGATYYSYKGLRIVYRTLLWENDEYTLRKFEAVVLRYLIQHAPNMVKREAFGYKDPMVRVSVHKTRSLLRDIGLPFKIELIPDEGYRLVSK